MAQVLTLYGLKTCDTCRKALRALEQSGIPYQFVDIRANPMGQDDLDRLVAAVGDAAVNRRSTTWRGLSEDERSQDPVDLLAAHPTLIKRPVILRTDGRLSIGWTPAIASELGAG